jgi:hypothetical protein
MLQCLMRTLLWQRLAFFFSSMKLPCMERCIGINLWHLLPLLPAASKLIAVPLLASAVSGPMLIAAHLKANAGSAGQPCLQS